jgi:inhibitor of cysteine peptidase
MNKPGILLPKAELSRFFRPTGPATENKKHGLSAMHNLPIIFLAVSVAFSPPAPIKLTEKDSGLTVEIAAGSVMEIILKGNPTTGYTWAVASVDESILTQIGEAEFKAERKARGSGGTITLRFRAEGEGKTCLRLIYHRPFERNMPPIKTFSVTVNVQ